MLKDYGIDLLIKEKEKVEEKMFKYQKSFLKVWL